MPLSWYSRLTELKAGNGSRSCTWLTVAVPMTPAAESSSAAQARVRTSGQSSALLFRAASKELGNASAAALWSVSDGKVRRSLDAGRTYQHVRVAKGITFQSFAASGREVWLGGADGALFHSADAGVTWSRASIQYEGSAITETIVEIRLHDPQHLSVTTASGAQWSTDDGGQQWRKP